jgi:serine/threonine-protein kinase
MVNAIFELGDTQSVPTSAEVVRTGPFRVGDVVGGAYAITGVLGAGGMGVVYDAVDQALKRHVALKAAAASCYAPALEAEARALAALRSPFFVQVHALGEHEGASFLVMERPVGETLEERISAAHAREAQIQISEVLAHLVMIAEGLSIAHTAGLSQRDLKPANVILSGGRVVLFDAGICVSEALVEPGALVAGSIEYMAPEVVLGAVSSDAGPMVDLYALGTVAYELLTLTTPFRGGTAREVLTRRLFEPAPDVREARPDVPAELAALIGDLLAIDVSTRPSGAEAVLWRLAELRDHGARRLQRTPIILESRADRASRSRRRTGR